MRPEGKALVEQSTYKCYMMVMEDVSPIPNYKIEFPKGKINRIRAYYNIRTDPELGLGFAALCRVVCGCNVCKVHLARPWLPHIDMHEQPRYAANEECLLWWSYEGANDWRICELFPVTNEDEKGAQDSVQCVLTASEARMSLMIWEGEVGAAGTTDDATMGYYVVKWTSNP